MIFFLRAPPRRFWQAHSQLASRKPSKRECKFHPSLPLPPTDFNCLQRPLKESGSFLHSAARLRDALGTMFPEFAPTEQPCTRWKSYGNAFEQYYLSPAPSARLPARSPSASAVNISNRRVESSPKRRTDGGGDKRGERGSDEISKWPP